MHKSWMPPAVAAALSLAAVLGATSVRADSRPNATAPVPATAPGTWIQHETVFDFMGFTTNYSCDGLADKLRVLLLAAGARADVKVSAGACAEGFGRPDKFARAILRFFTLAPLSADTPASGVAAAAASSPVDGVWRGVVLSRRVPRELSVGDCELVEQFLLRVVPLFATRQLENRTVCVPHQETGSNIDVKFETFTAPATAAKSHPVARS